MSFWPPGVYNDEVGVALSDETVVETGRTVTLTMVEWVSEPLFPIADRM